MIKVFIGTDPTQWLPTEVLKHSIRRRTKEAVEFKELKDIDLGLRTKMFTGFSFYRYAIPEQCGYEGRALYLDADMVVLADLNELWSMEMKEKPVLSKRRDDNSWFTSCMVMDCSRLKHWKPKEWVSLINTGIVSYPDTMNGGPGALNHHDFERLPDCWNAFDKADDQTKLIHYTSVPTQPWKKPGHPFRHLFLKELQSALDEGVLSLEDVEKEIRAGHIYPTILEDMAAIGAK